MSYRLSDHPNSMPSTTMANYVSPPLSQGRTDADLKCLLKARETAPRKEDDATANGAGMRS